MSDVCSHDGEDKASSADEPNTTASGVTEVTSGLYDQVHSSDKLSLVGKPSDNDDLYSQTNKDAERNDKDLEDSDKPAAPDGGWGWWCVVGCALAHFFIGGFERSGGILLLQLQSKFGSGTSSTTWIISLSATLRLLLGPLASVLSNKFSCRRVVIAGGLIFSAGVMISAFMPELEILYLTYGILGGLGKSFAYAPGLVIVGQYFKKRRSLAVGVATAGGGLGTLLLPPLFEILFEEWGFTGAFIILAGFPLHLCISGGLYRPLVDNKDKHRKLKDDETDDIELMPLRHKEEVDGVNNTDDHITKSAESDELTEKEKNALLIKRPSLKEIKRKILGKDDHESKKLIDLTLLKNSRFLTFCIGICFLSLAFNSVLIFIPPLAKDLGLTRLQGAYILSISGLFDILGRLGSGVILNLKKIKPFRMIIYNTAMFLLGFLTFTLPLSSSFIALSIAGAFYGLLTGIYTSQKSVILADILGSESLNSSFGILICFQGIGTLLGPPFTGFLKDVSHSYDDGFYFVACVTLLGACTLTIGNVYFYFRHRSREPKTTQNDGVNGD